MRSDREVPVSPEEHVEGWPGSVPLAGVTFLLMKKRSTRHHSMIRRERSVLTLHRFRTTAAVLCNIFNRVQKK